MKSIIIKNGLYASIVVVGLPFMMWLFSSGEPNYEFGEIIGYSVMIISMIFVYLGIRQYRNETGSITFENALKVGMLIAIIPSVLFGIYDLIYVTYLDPDFIDTYYSISLEKMKTGMSPDEYKTALDDLESQKEFWMNPFFQFTIMSATVLIIGFIASIISSIILKTKKTPTL